MEKISFIGCGSWGGALGKVLSDKGYLVKMWHRNKKIVSSFTGFNGINILWQKGCRWLNCNEPLKEGVNKKLLVGYKVFVWQDINRKVREELLKCLRDFVIPNCSEGAFERLDVLIVYSRSKRSAFITFVQAATKSLANFSLLSS